jgi:hypothetical protein
MRDDYMSRKNTNLILELIDDQIIDPKKFLESLLSAMSESEVTDNLEYIARVEDWDEEIQKKIKE